MLEQCGRPNARVTVLENPRVSGFEHACSLMPEIVERWAHFDLLLFLPDADGQDRTPLFDHLESKARDKLICCAAVQEVEAWLLAGHVGRLGRPWPEVRFDISVKENVFEPFLRQFGDTRLPGGGRDRLMRETLANYQGLLNRCPELAALQARVCAAFSSNL